MLGVHKDSVTLLMRKLRMINCKQEEKVLHALSCTQSLSIAKKEKSLRHIILDAICALN